MTDYGSAGNSPGKQVGRTTSFKTTLVEVNETYSTSEYERELVAGDLAPSVSALYDRNEKAKEEEQIEGVPPLYCELLTLIRTAVFA